jgi:hypothetical protein
VKDLFPLVIAGALAWLLYSLAPAAVSPAVMAVPLIGTNPVRGAAPPVLQIPSGGGAIPGCPPGLVCQSMQSGGGPCTVTNGVMTCPM